LHCGWYPDYRQPQLFNRTKMRYNDELVHEGYTLDGRLGYLREHVLQYPWDTIEIATAKLQRYSTLMAQRYADAGKRASLGKLVGSPLPGSNTTGWGTYFPNGRHVVSVFGSGVGVVWDVDPADWEREACAVANRELTPAEWHDSVPERGYRRVCAVAH